MKSEVSLKALYKKGGTGIDIQRKLSDKTSGKAENLIWLKKNQFLVPEFFIVTSDFFKAFLNINDLEPTIVQLVQIFKDSENKSEVVLQLQNLFLKAQFPEDLEFFIKQNLLLFDKSDLFAVRSSASDEDGFSYSFAGQLDSYLFQKNLDQIKISIIKCWASLYGMRSLSYRMQNHLNMFPIEMSVIIQKMIRAESSGVLFTDAPNNRNNLAISCNFGIGEGIVGGHCICDEYEVVKKSSELIKQINVKDKKIDFNQDLQAGTIEVALSNVDQRRAVLNDDQIKTLSEKSLEIEALKGYPCDIEWALFNNKMYFLQVRPITGKQKQTDKLIFDNSNIQESYCGVTTPLTFSYARNAYASVYRHLMKVLNFSQKEIEASEFRHEHMLGYVQGRVYYNILSWYEGLTVMPSFGRSKEDMEQMMGLEHPVDFVQDIQVELKDKLKMLPKMIVLVLKIVYAYAKLPKSVAHFDRRFWELYRQAKSTNWFELSSLETINKLNYYKAAFLKEWGTPIVNDFYVMSSNGQARRALKKIGAEDLLPHLLHGNDIESTAPTLKLLFLADLVRKNDSVKKVIFDFEPECAWLMLESRYPVVFAQLQDYIRLYGDRVAGELKLETVTYHQNPSMLLISIKSYLQPGTMTLAAYRERQKRLLDSSLRDLKELIPSLIKYRKILKKINKVKRGIQYREQMRMHRSRVFGIVREIYLHLGLKLEAAKLIKEQRDVFFLTEQEIEAQFTGQSLYPDFFAVIELRKKQNSEYKTLDPEGQVTAQSPVKKYVPTVTLAPELVPTGDQKVLKGIGCYNGIVDAAVVVMLEADFSVDLKGKILCTVRTDPGWAPLFINISGLLVEKGSTLSHSAIVARELGIPTVVGVPKVTQILQTNQIVKLNGGTGEIWI